MITRFRFALLTIILCVILTGCGARDLGVDKAGIKEYYKALGGMKMQVGISADFPERVSKYRVGYTYKKDDKSSIEIIEPEEVSGIKVSVKDGEGEIEFDGSRLETGKLDGRGLTPLNALPRLMKKWSGGEISQTELGSRDGVDTILLIYSDDGSDEDTEYRTWFNRENYYPIYSEIISDGRCVIRCEYETILLQ